MMRKHWDQLIIVWNRVLSWAIPLSIVTTTSTISPWPNTLLQGVSVHSRSLYPALPCSLSLSPSLLANSIVWTGSSHHIAEIESIVGHTFCLEPSVKSEGTDKEDEDYQPQAISKRPYNTLPCDETSVVFGQIKIVKGRGGLWKKFGRRSMGSKNCWVYLEVFSYSSSTLSNTPSLTCCNRWMFYTCKSWCRSTNGVWRSYQRQCILEKHS